MTPQVVQVIPPMIMLAFPRRHPLSLQEAYKLLIFPPSKAHFGSKALQAYICYIIKEDKKIGCQKEKNKSSIFPHSSDYKRLRSVQVSLLIL